MIKIIEDAITKFKSARKGEEVRNALVDVAEFACAYSMKAITFGTEISENETVASSDYFDGMGYLNTETGDLFKVEDGKWIKKGNLSGKDGESITGASENVEGGVKVTLYDKNTEEVIDTFMLFNGQNGQDGQNGASLTVEHSKSGLVTTVTIKNAETGAVIDTFEINDGKSGTGTGDMLESDYAGESATKSVHKADSATNATDATNAENLKKSDGTTVDADTITTKLSKLDSNGKIDYSDVKNTPNFTEPTDLEKGIVGSDEYSATETYGTNDGLKNVCIHSNKIYSAKQANFSGVEPTVTSGWEEYWEETSISALETRLSALNSNLETKVSIKNMQINFNVNKFNIDTDNFIGVFYINSAFASGTHPTDIGSIYMLIGYNATQYGCQIAIGFNSNKIAIRNKTYNSNIWQDWRYI